ncbi:alpha/beta hydrolase [Sphingomonas hylomeconis]|uniref:Alpha/beta hydrolase n=1 Tax=Sphingomonas hylomeconis TaxID=1395958 RepID=A0ABV7SYM6_9SPHN|nr:alpha/beta hydrolase [Sphingomonas hylomeconis]
MNSPQTYRRAIPADAHIDTWAAPDGWKLRCFDWPAAGQARGSILFQGGRGDIFEKYLETFAHWHDAGWNVTSLDWRGQGGSGRLSANPHVGHVEDFAHYIADFRAFWALWQAATPGPHVLIGHSMGGHLALRAMVEGAATPAAAVLVAPMLGLHSPIGAALGERMAKLVTRLGNPARSAWKGNERPATTTTREALLTHDHGRYEDEIWWQRERPELLLGPPSWKWLSRAFESTRALRDDPRLATMPVPTLLIVAEADKLVSPAAALQVATRLPDARVMQFGAESAHEVLREADGVRDRALGEIDRFLAAHAPAG